MSDIPACELVASRNCESWNATSSGFHSLHTAHQGLLNTKWFAVLFRLWLVVVFVFFLSGCSDIGQMLTDAINSKWPPVSVDERRLSAVRVSHENLTSIDQAHVALRIQPSAVLEPLRDQLARVAPQLKNPDLTFDKQSVKLSAFFSESVPVEGISINIEGEVLGYAGIGVDDSDLVVAPVLESVHVKEIKLDEDIDIGLATGVVNAFFENYIDNINGNIRELKPTRYPLIPQGADESNGDTRSIERLFLEKLAVLIESDGLSAIAQLNVFPTDKTPYPNQLEEGPGTGEFEAEFSEFSKAFNDKRERQFGVVDTAKVIWIKIADKAIASLLGDIYQPVPDLEQRWKAVEAARRQMESVGTPNAMAFAGAQFLAPYLESELRRIADEQDTIPLSDFRVSFGDQIIGLTASFSVAPDGGKFGARGQVTGFVALGAAGHALTFHPALTSLKVDAIDVEEPLLIDMPVAVSTVNDVLAQMLNLANVILREHAPPPVELTFDPIGSIDLGADLAKTKGVSNVEGTIIKPAIGVENGTVMISTDGVFLPLRVGLSEERREIDFPDDISVPDDLSEDSFQQVYAAYRDAVIAEAQSFIPANATSPVVWVGLRKDLLSAVLNSNLKQLSVCGNYDLATLSSSPIDSLVGSDRHNQIDCSPTRDCKPTFSCSRKKDDRNCTPHKCELKEDRRDCRPHSCTRKHDTRNCKKSIGFGVKINDPICEAAKAAQNVIYDTEYAGCRVDAARLKTQCEVAKAAQNKLYEAGYAGCNTDAARLKTQCEAAKATQNGLYELDYQGCQADRARLKVQCEAEKATEKLACEAYKEGVKQISDYGRVKGKLSAAGAPRLCIAGVEVASDLSTVKVSGSLSGSAKVRADIKYTPHNLLGHLACNAEWSGPIKADISLPNKEFNLSGSITGEKDSDDALLLKVMTDPQELTVQMRPKPVDALFGSNPDALLKCTALAAISYAVQLADAFMREHGEGISDELAGLFKFPLDSQLHQFLIEPMKVNVAGQSFKVKPVWRSLAVVFEGNPELRAQ